MRTSRDRGVILVVVGNPDLADVVQQNAVLDR